MFKFCLGLITTLAIVITVGKAETYFNTDYDGLSRDCLYYEDGTKLGQKDISKCMWATFTNDCKYDRTGRPMKNATIDECTYSSWSGDCKTKDIYVETKKGSGTFTVTEGVPVDPKEMLDQMKACLKTNSRLTDIDEFRNINEETSNIILVTILIVMIIGTCCLLQSREILCAKKPGEESNKCMQCWEHVDPPRVDTVGSDDEEAPAEHQASQRNMMNA